MFVLRRKSFGITKIPYASFEAIILQMIQFIIRLDLWFMSKIRLSSSSSYSVVLSHVFRFRKKITGDDKAEMLRIGKNERDIT